MPILKVMQAIELKRGTQNKEETQRVTQLVQEAIALDPGYAIPYSILACPTLRVGPSWREPVAQRVIAAGR